MEIAQKDTSKLAKPTIQQEEIRNKIYINEMTKQVAKENGENPDNIKLPYSLSDNEIKLAKDFSEYELAERNKEYALITMAILAKQYSNDIEKAAGDSVPLTDLPGASVMVETLRHSDAKIINTIFQNKSPLLFISLPINALDNVVTVI